MVDASFIGDLPMSFSAGISANPWTQYGGSWAYAAYAFEPDSVSEASDLPELLLHS
jgi:hypothetical protein